MFEIVPIIHDSLPVSLLKWLAKIPQIVSFRRHLDGIMIRVLIGRPYRRLEIFLGPAAAKDPDLHSRYVRGKIEYFTEHPAALDEKFEAE